MFQPTNHRRRSFYRRAIDWALRLAGLGLLVLCRDLAGILRGWVAAQPLHQPSPGDFALAAVIVVLIAGGLGLMVEGAGITRQVPIPRQSAFYRFR